MGQSSPRYHRARAGSDHCRREHAGWPRWASIQADRRVPARGRVRPQRDPSGPSIEPSTRRADAFGACRRVHRAHAVLAIHLRIGAHGYSNGLEIPERRRRVIEAALESAQSIMDNAWSVDRETDGGDIGSFHLARDVESEPSAPVTTVAAIPCSRIARTSWNKSRRK